MATSLKCQRSRNIGTTPTVIGGYTAPSVTTGVFVTGLNIANVTGGAITVTVDIFDGANAYNLIKTAPIPSGGNIVLADDGHRIVLASGDQVRVTSNTATSVDAVMSISEIT